MTEPLGQGTFYPITGRKNTGGVFDRIPIEDMQKNHPRQFTLFVLSYAAVQGVRNTPVSAAFPGLDLPATTYMEIAGIHGKPYKEYAGDRKGTKEKEADYDSADPKDTLPVPSRFGGYCNHGSVSFTTWHRPYMLLIEQAVGNVADRIAADIEKNNHSEVGKWVPEAKKLRFPYWDWAEPRVEKEGLPPVFYEEKLTITVAGGRTTAVSNPFAYYTYEAPIPSDFENETTEANETAYFAVWKRTYRHAASSPNPNGSNIEELQKVLKSQAADIRHKIALLFAFPEGEDPAIAYDKFSNEINESRREQDYQNLGSLESVHGDIHGVLGGNGHMSDPDYAAFDPIFFFHHSNVDRIIALWEWCYRDYWMGDGYVNQGKKYPWTQERGTYAQVYNEQILPSGARGGLFPFRNEKGQYWTNEQTRFLDADAYPKYYSYQEFQGIKVDRKASKAIRIRARARISQYYGFDPRVSAGKADQRARDHLNTVSPTLEDEIPENFKAIRGFRVFIVLVRLPEHAFNRSYKFELHYNHGNESQLVGTVTVFARSDHSPCKACAKRREAGSVIRGIVPLRPSMINDIIINSGVIRSQATLETTTESITKALYGKLVDMSGKLLATADGGAISPVPDRKAASSKVTPVETTLYTSAVADKVEEDGQLVHMFDWKPHNDLFPYGWKALSSEAS